MPSPRAAAIARTRLDLEAILSPWRNHKEKICLVPTMGALHDGHLSLIRQAKKLSDRVIVSVFVNPRQFGPNEDFATYPRDEMGDVEKAESAGADVIFTPDINEMYPDGYQTIVSVPKLANCMDGTSRPGFFDGVATVVTKLFTQTRPDQAIFGEKDFQQLQIIKRLSLDLNLGVEVIGAPIIREADGLAMSSRNRYLSADERAVAGNLNVVLRETAQRLVDGAEIDAALQTGRAQLEAAGLQPIDYFDLRIESTLAKIDSEALPRPCCARLFVAVMLGRTRLIDNWPVHVEG